jgi:hypothetical protein
MLFLAGRGLSLRLNWQEPLDICDKSDGFHIGNNFNEFSKERFL